MASPSCQIVVAGAAHVDRTGWLDAPAQPACSNPGHFVDSPGGTGLNVASVLASLGHRPLLLTAIGRDDAGRQLLQSLQERGVETILSGGQGCATATYTSVIEPDGTLHVAVADMAIYEKFRAKPVLGRLAALGRDDWLCVDANLPPPQLKKLLNATQAKRVGLTVSKAKAHRLRPVCGELDLIFTNRVEACALCAINENSSDQGMIAALRGLQSGTAVITNGAGPVTIVSAAKTIRVEVENLDHITDVTGAGDALVAATLHALSENQVLAAAVSYGIQASAATIQHRGSLRRDLAHLLRLPGKTATTTPD